MRCALVSCTPTKDSWVGSQESLNRARTTLDKGAATPDVASKWPDVGGFKARPLEIKSPEVWAFFEVRMHGDASDLKRCLPYVNSKDNELRREAEQTYVYLAKPKEASKLSDLLRLNDKLTSSLVLSYAGLDSATPTDQELQTLLNNPDTNIQNMARAVMKNKSK